MLCARTVSLTLSLLCRMVRTRGRQHWPRLRFRAKLTPQALRCASAAQALCCAAAALRCLRKQRLR